MIEFEPVISRDAGVYNSLVRRASVRAFENQIDVCFCEEIALLDFQPFHQIVRCGNSDFMRFVLPQHNFQLDEGTESFNFIYVNTRSTEKKKRSCLPYFSDDGERGR